MGTFPQTSSGSTESLFFIRPRIRNGISQAGADALLCVAHLLEVDVTLKNILTNRLKKNQQKNSHSGTRKISGVAAEDVRDVEALKSRDVLGSIPIADVEAIEDLTNEGGRGKEEREEKRGEGERGTFTGKEASMTR